VVHREGALDPARPKDSPTHGQVLSYLRIPGDTANIITDTDIYCYIQVTKLRHKGVKRKGNRTNRNPATAGMRVMNAGLGEAACQCECMGQVLGELGLYLYVSVCMHLYLVSIRMYVHLSRFTCQALTFISCYQDLAAGTSGSKRNLPNRMNRQIQGTS
jgi:hypothetical protein